MDAPMLLKRLLPYAALFLFLQTILRISLLVRSYMDVGVSFVDGSKVMLTGLWFDIVICSFFMLPVALFYWLLPARKQGGKLDHRTDKTWRFIVTFVLLFDMIAEHLFWTEFTARFNFIAVDYLIYTQEVIGNIIESYPLFWLLSGIAVAALLLTWLSLRLWPQASIIQPEPFKHRTRNMLLAVSVSLALYLVSHIEQGRIKDNAEASELAASGIYNLFYAFWNNEISYDRFYATQSDEQVSRTARALLSDGNSHFLQSEGRDMTRLIQANAAEMHKNVIIVSMESLSADYMGVFGSKDGLTPNLDRLSGEGLSFTQTYATGTRTVRGLEAMTLSIPPTPGQSILRRPGNEDLFSLGFIFKDRGYDTAFIYGGYGYFDNMNNFFQNNGFGIIDRAEMAKDKIHFANVWGICDEDMFTRSLEEADKSYASHKPFVHLIMTTSNHRPFSYPEGRINIESHSGRFGGVKYADYSVGKLVDDAKKKPWFKDTIFIFIADHTAGAGGKAELDSHKYHIPMIFYAPGMVKPQRFETLASQIDMAPTLLGMLNFSYYTKFYGTDLLHPGTVTPHAYISNYQKVGLIKNNTLTVLAPKRKIETYSWPQVEVSKATDPSLGSDAIAYYQSASWWKDLYKRIPSIATPKP